MERLRLLPTLLVALTLSASASARPRRLPAHAQVRPGTLRDAAVDAALLRLGELDAPYRVEVDIHERPAPSEGLLFGDHDGDIHPSYEATVDFCREFDPFDSDDDEVSDARIREYLTPLLEMAPLAEAMRVTGRDRVEDLMAVWFRRGRGFEHVICGETGGRDVPRTKLGGYHYWYIHYRYERDGTARYLGSDYMRQDLAAGMADPHIVTGKFTWDPDGDGPHPVLSKRPVGGFSTGHSVAAMLAAGHLSFWGGKRSPVTADLNGRPFQWTFYRMWRQGASSLRSYWPRFAPRP